MDLTGRVAMTWKASGILIALWVICCPLAGCASMTRVPEALPASEDYSAGDGTAIGSILMSVPTGMSDADEQKMIESLKRGTFAATVRRFEAHDLGISSWTEYLGRRYQVPFEIGVERQFVLRAPAVSVTLLGMRTESHLADNLRYYAASPLTEREYAALADAKTAWQSG